MELNFEHNKPYNYIGSLIIQFMKSFSMVIFFQYSENPKRKVYKLYVSIKYMKMETKYEIIKHLNEEIKKSENKIKKIRKLEIDSNLLNIINCERTIINYNLNLIEKIEKGDFEK